MSLLGDGPWLVRALMGEMVEMISDWKHVARVGTGNETVTSIMEMELYLLLSTLCLSCALPWLYRVLLLTVWVGDGNASWLEDIVGGGGSGVGRGCSGRVTGLSGHLVTKGSSGAQLWVPRYRSFFF